VWFSIEGAPAWLQASAKILPLTHLLTAARKVMNEGEGLLAVMPEIAILCAMTLTFLLVGATFFSWNK
jgi:ABC-type multidrug transport system permease subunit